MRRVRNRSIRVPYPRREATGWGIACGSTRETSLVPPLLPPDHPNPGGPSFHGFIAKRWGNARDSGSPASLLAGVSGSARPLLLSGAVATLFAITGCHHKPPQVSQQAPPPVTRYPSRPANPAPSSPSVDDTAGPPVYTEVGLASWYGPSFNRRAAADGSLYDQDGLTAAHRTLPMGSTVRVTNLATGQQVFVRITDRGPFVRGRILDLSMGAAKAVGLYRMGVGRVRVEAFRHTSADPPGRWCVQTGPFVKENDATDLKEALLKRYRGARVAEFHGPTGFWVRIDPVDHARSDALEIQDWIGDPDPSAVPYLVRID